MISMNMSKEGHDILLWMHSKYLHFNEFYHQSSIFSSLKAEILRVLLIFEHCLVLSFSIFWSKLIPFWKNINKKLCSIFHLDSKTFLWINKNTLCSLLINLMVISYFWDVASVWRLAHAQHLFYHHLFCNAHV